MTTMQWVAAAISAWLLLSPPAAIIIGKMAHARDQQKPRD
jgi:hypothetical protein